jgi:sigma-54-specific transcriptional regulator
MRSVGIRQEESAQPLRLQTPEAPSLEAALTALFEQNVEDLYEHIEETVFRTAYRYCHGNQLQTGRLLNISRNIVRARLEKIGELKRSDTVGL